VTTAPSRPHTPQRMSAVRPLTRAQQQELKAELLRERARLERSVATSARAEGIASRGASGPAAAPSGESAAIHIALHGRVHDRRESIDEALRRLENGTYGTCAGCRSVIPYGRLLVMPETSYCVACGARP
jgi:DnaK suppressor protein